MNLLLSYNWPGNIRELQHMTEKAVIMGEGRVLQPGDFFMKSQIRPQVSETTTLNLKQLEIVAINKAIEKNDGNITRAVRDLGISRRALYYKMKKYDI